MNERIERLKERFLSSERKVDIERAMIVTETYRENEEKPQIIKRALALKAILSRMGIDLRDDELIVGNQNKARSKWIRSPQGKGTSSRLPRSKSGRCEKYCLTGRGDVSATRSRALSPLSSRRC
jgi:pyruvate-formate lyase